MHQNACTILTFKKNIKKFYTPPFRRLRQLDSRALVARPQCSRAPSRLAIVPPISPNPEYATDSNPS